MTNSPSIVWFRRDLRLADNPALMQAVKRGGPIVPLFIYSKEDDEGTWALGGASKWWLHHALTDLDKQLQKRKTRLVIRQGEALPALTQLIKEVEAGAVFWNRLYEPYAIARDQEIKEKLKSQGLAVESFNGSLLYEPWQVMNLSAKPFQVFTPFWHAIIKKGEIRPTLPDATKLGSFNDSLKSQPLDKLALLPKIHWDATIANTWQPNRQGAQDTLDNFCQDGLVHYLQGRDRPDLTQVSRLSPYLHFGQISVLEVWHQVKEAAAALPAKQQEAGNKSADTYLKELGWREFAHHLLFHFPATTDKPLRSEFARFAWSTNKNALHAWQKGQTGYPMVDAGMRELWATGWMHNRVRMIVASFLEKDLMIHWLEGAKWFWDTLLDADLAANTLGWQWTAGCGADAQPYFRIFNPITQGEKFDPDGNYVRKWVPELKHLPTKVIHSPWLADASVLSAARVKLGKDYPQPIVDHGQARRRALAAFKSMKEDK